MTILYNDVIKFWFEDTTPEQKWIKDPKFDALIRKKFTDIHDKSIKGELSAWRLNAIGALAEIIILDQFSRNMYRGTKEAFANDGLALKLAEEAIEKNYDKEIEKDYLSFLYMPFMHSESVNVHERALVLFNQEGLEDSYQYELKHKVIIDRFGRYPHRNEILGRDSTPEEIVFLKGPDSSF
tara:strand:- start:509 stop:1054 length:546 start_codon:yes stop_codon:yes gene_type:complete